MQAQMLAHMAVWSTLGTGVLLHRHGLDVATLEAHQVGTLSAAAVAVALTQANRRVTRVYGLALSALVPVANMGALVVFA